MEINVSVLDANEPIASVTEIPVASSEVLSYEDKYLKGGGKKAAAGRKAWQLLHALSIHQIYLKKLKLLHAIMQLTPLNSRLQRRCSHRLHVRFQHRQALFQRDQSHSWIPVLLSLGTISSSCVLYRFDNTHNQTRRKNLSRKNLRHPRFWFPRFEQIGC